MGKMLSSWVLGSEDKCLGLGIPVRKGVNADERPPLLILENYSCFQRLPLAFGALRVVSGDVRRVRFLSLPLEPEVSLVLRIPWDLGDTGCLRACTWLNFVLGTPRVHMWQLSPQCDGVGSWWSLSETRRRG